MIKNTISSLFNYLYYYLHDCMVFSYEFGTFNMFDILIGIITLTLVFIVVGKVLHS